MIAAVAAVAAALSAAAGGTMVGTLEPENLPGMCLTLPAGATEAVSAACTGKPDQIFGFPGPDGGVLRHDGACMGIEPDGVYPALVPMACDNSPFIYFIVDHQRRLANNAGRCLAVLGGSSREGERVYGAPCESTAQVWIFSDPAEEGYAPASARIAVTASPGVCLALQDGNFFAPAPCDTGDAQVFRLDRTRAAQLRMKSGCLVPAATGAPVGIHDCTATDLWLFGGDGKVRTGRDCAVLDAEGVLRTADCAGAPKDVLRLDVLP